MTPIRAELDKSNRCDAAGYTVTGYVPVLATYPSWLRTRLGNVSEAY
jgi:hypothetical protein